jgi:hypothetical protein
MGGKTNNNAMGSCQKNRRDRYQKIRTVMQLLLYVTKIDLRSRPYTLMKIFISFLRDFELEKKKSKQCSLDQKFKMATE